MLCESESGDVAGELDQFGCFVFSAVTTATVELDDDRGWQQLVTAAATSRICMHAKIFSLSLFFVFGWEITEQRQTAR